MSLLEELQQIDGYLAKAERLGIALVDKVHARQRESLVNVALPRMLWPAQTLGERRESFVHGDERPLYLTRMTAEVTASYTTVAGVEPVEHEQLFKTPIGWFALRDGTPIVGPFDFEWNFSVGRRQSYYSRDAFASSQILAGQERGQYLEFATPIVLNTGESIEGVVRATLTDTAEAAGEGASGASFFVKLRFDGFRG